VISLEDIHWADNSSLDMVNRLVRKMPEQRLLIVCLARHRLFDRLPNWGEGLSCHRRVELRSLTKHESGQLVEEILHMVKQVPTALRELVVKRAEGNPYSIEEMIKMLVEDGVIITGAAYWQIEPDRLTELDVPSTLTGVLQARLDGLPQREREVLQKASVVGRIFWDNAVEYMSAEVTSGEGQAAAGSTDEDLSSLCGRELIYRREDSAFAEAGEYTFKHAILRDVTYETILIRLRRVYHGLMAEWLIQFVGERAEEYASLIADHFHNAEDYERAFTYFRLAAQRAASIYANDEAITHYTRAIEVSERITSDVLEVAELHRGRGLVFERLGEFDRARRDYTMTVQMTRAAGKHQLEWRALIDLGKLWSSRDYNQARDYFERALELAREMDDPAILAGSVNWMGNWYSNDENPIRASEYHQEALTIFEELWDRRELANTLDLLGLASILGGDLTTSVQYYNRAIVLFRELDDRTRLASSLLGRANTFSMLVLLSSVPAAPLPDARYDLNEALRIAGEIGSAPDEAWAYYSLGLLHTVHGHFGHALQDLQSGLRIASEIGHREFLVGSRFALGVWYAELFALDQARGQFEEALALAEELRSPTWIHIVSGGLAGAYMMLDDLKSVQTCLEKVLSPQTPMDTLGKRYCWVRRAELALAQGDPAMALEIVERLIATAPGIRSGDVITFLWLLKGEALAALGGKEEAHALLGVSLENARANEERFLLWRVHASLGRLYDAEDRQTEACEEYSAAGGLVEQLAASIDDEVLKDNFLQGAISALRTPAC